ncbi:MAG: hypothetical protein QOK31_1212 [Solirubrobacteraceae bacterium]|nr:hypothetical protein [Solirubrobacteraceae bacterium]
MHDLVNTTTGIVALAGAAVAAVALIVAAVMALRVRRLRADQRTVLGDGKQDLVGHATEMTQEFRSLHAYVEDAMERLHERMSQAEQRLDGSIAYRGLVRYDAYNEMSGRQSTSIALLDASQSGVVLSSIHHRDQARLYAKQVRAGKSELELSPEEQEAMRLALDGATSVAASS